jgi:hypothetical protein
MFGRPGAERQIVSDVLKTFGGIWLAPFIFGLIGLANTTMAWHRGARVATWPRTPGTVTHSRIKKGKGWSDMGQGQSTGGTVYRPKIIYSYEVGGKHFQGTRVQFGTRWRERVKSKAASAITPYPVGQAVQVYYDPQRPGDSVLKPGVAPFWKKSVIFSLGMFALSGCLWLAAFVTR